MPSLQDKIKEKLKRPPSDLGLSDRIKSRLTGSVAEQLGQAELGPPGLEDVGARAAIAAGDTLDEKISMLKKFFPEAELRELASGGNQGSSMAKRTQNTRGFETLGLPSTKEISSEIPAGRELYAKLDPSQPFVKVDAGFFEKFEPIQDLADLSGDLGPVVGEILLGKGAGGLLSFLARTGFGSFLGEFAQEAGENLISPTKETLQNITERATSKGVGTAIGGLASVPIVGGINVARGSGSFNVTEAGAEALKSAERLNLTHKPSVDQITGSPLLQRIGQLARQTSGHFADYDEALRKEVVGKLRGFADQKAIAKLRDNLEVSHDNMINTILTRAKNDPVGLAEGGSALKAGAANYIESSGAMVNKLYKNARDIEAPQLDATNLKSTAQGIAKGIPIQMEDGRVVDAQGLSGELAEVTKILSEVDPKLPTIDGVNGVEQLRAIRSRLYELKNPDIGKTPSNENSLANHLFTEVNNTLNNPANTNDLFRQAWAVANTNAAKRFDAIDKLEVITKTRNDSLENLALNYGKPNSASAINQIRGLISNKDFSKFQNSIMTDLLRRANVGEDLTKIIKSYDKETIGKIMRPDQIADFNRIGKELNFLKKANIQEHLENQSSDMLLIDDMVNTNSSRAISEILKTIEHSPGGTKGELAKSMRSATMELMFTKIIQRKKGSDAISESALNDIFTKFKQTGATKFLSPEDLSAIKDVNSLAPFIKFEAGEAGASLSGAATARGALGFLSLAEEGSNTAIRHLIENIGVARLFTSKTGRRLLTGRGVDKKDFKTLKLIGATMGELNAQLPEEEQ